MSGMIEARHVSFSYRGAPALEDVSLTVAAGECVAIMGPNASGKSTLARVMNGLLAPDNGECLVDGVSTRADPARARHLVGLVFESPDDQAVASRVEDDVAFGPRNLGALDVSGRVAEALRLAGIQRLAGRNIRSLSGGEKQLVAIAGVLAMRPAYLVLDEPTSLLDQDGGRMVADAIDAIRDENRGVVILTHDPSIAARADRIAVMAGGRVLARGTPAEIFSSRVDSLVATPEMARLAARLKARGVAIRHAWLSVEDALGELCP